MVVVEAARRGKQLGEVHCCVASSWDSAGMIQMSGWVSDAEREVVECHSKLVTGGDFGGDLVVAAAQILHEGMTGG